MVHASLGKVVSWWQKDMDGNEGKEKPVADCKNKSHMSYELSTGAKKKQDLCSHNSDPQLY